MNGSEKFESSGAKDRIKNLFILAVFTVLALIASIIIMDIIVYPIAVSAVKNTPLFNAFIKYGFFSSIAGVIIFMAGRRVINLRKDGMSSLEILKYFVKRPGHYAGIFTGFLIITGAVIAIIYLMLSYNYYILYKISGS